MTVPEIIAIMALAAVLGIAIGYIIYTKHKGGGCVGCPYSKSCAGECSCKGNKK